MEYAFIIQNQPASSAPRGRWHWPPARGAPLRMARGGRDRRTISADLGPTSDPISARRRPDPTRPRPRPDRRRPTLTYGERPIPVAYVGVLSRAMEVCPDSRDRCGWRTGRRTGPKRCHLGPHGASIEGGPVTADERMTRPHLSGSVYRRARVTRARRTCPPGVTRSACRDPSRTNLLLYRDCN